MLPVRRGLVLRGRLSASMKGGLNGYSVAWLFATMTLSSGLPVAQRRNAVGLAFLRIGRRLACPVRRVCDNPSRGRPATRGSS